MLSRSRRYPLLNGVGVDCCRMRGFEQLESCPAAAGERTGVFVPGCFDVGFPYIHLETNLTIGDALRRICAGKGTQSDQELIYTFFHEYLHLVQSSAFEVCQLPILYNHSLIYDIRVAGIKTRNGGRKLMDHIEPSEDTKLICRRIKDRYAVIDLRLSESECRPFGCVNLLEGAARLLEEEFRGAIVDEDNWRYTAIRTLNKIYLPKSPLDNRSLLEVCDVALRCENAAKTFCDILQALGSQGAGVPAVTFDSVLGLAIKLGCKICNSLSHLVRMSTAKTFGGPLFSHYVKQVQIIYDRMPRFFGGGALFSKIYDELQNDDKRGLPNCLIAWMANCGSPIVVNDNGVIEAFDIDYRNVSSVDQNVLGVRAIVESVLHPNKTICAMKRFCEFAVSQGHSLPLDESCDQSPWTKKPWDGKLCPYSAIWRAFGLEGLILK